MRAHDFYDQHAEQCFEQYQSLTFEQVHASWLDLLPNKPGFALDVGAGSGRDATALAKQGWEVLAVEPAQALLERGKNLTQGLPVHWLPDALPQLPQVRALGQTFNLIVLSAVWMHLPPSEREQAFRVLAGLLAPGGLLVISLRHGPSTDQRVFHAVSVAEVDQLAKQWALKALRVVCSDDKLQRQAVRWDTVVLQLQDDGTGALPLVRHIIVNDRKTSTYKLALLRCVTLIAETLPGLVIRRTDSHVVLPLGALALVWQLDI